MAPRSNTSHVRARRRKAITQTIKIATLLPPGYPPSQAWEHVAQRTLELSEGRLRFELEIPFTGGNEMEALLRVRSGELDMVSVTTYVAGALVPLAQLLDLPFVFPDRDAAHSLLDGPLGGHILESFESFGLHGLAFFENGMRHFTNSLHPIRRPSDMRKMRVRIQDSVVYLALMHALGASPKVIPFGDVYRSLQNHEVDAQENPLPNTLGARLYEVQRYLSLTSHTYNTQIVLGNIERWRQLPPQDREIIARRFAKPPNIIAASRAKRTQMRSPTAKASRSARATARRARGLRQDLALRVGTHGAALPDRRFPPAPQPQPRMHGIRASTLPRSRGAQPPGSPSTTSSNRSIARSTPCARPATRSAHSHARRYRASINSHNNR